MSTCSTRSPERRRSSCEVLNKQGQLGWCRVNWLYPPFNNVKARQAMLYLIHHTEVMKATFGDEKYFKGCSSLFGMGTPMENDANIDWFKGGQNIEKAKQLLKESGYDGRPVVVLQATNIAYMNNAADLIAQWMRKAGFNVSLQASDWGAVITRRAVKAAARPGRLERLLHLGLGQRLRQSHRARRPCRQWRQGLVRLAD